MATAIGSVFANLALETAGFNRDVDGILHERGADQPPKERPDLRSLR